jgi:hypothetical protein
MDARRQRFREFLEKHELFVTGVNFDPATVDVWEMIAERGIPPSWLERIEKEFKASEFKREVKRGKRVENSAEEAKSRLTALVADYRQNRGKLKRRFARENSYRSPHITENS